MVIRSFLISSLSVLMACGTESVDEVVESSRAFHRNIRRRRSNDAPSFESGVTTLAGSGDMESIDGVGENASFGEPGRFDCVRWCVGGSGQSHREIRLVQMDGTVESLDLVGDLPIAPSGLAVTGAISFQTTNSTVFLRLRGLSLLCLEK